MAKLLKKHFGLGAKKTGSSAHRQDYETQKISTAHVDLLPKSPTRYRSSVSLSTSNHHESFDTHSLKSFGGDCHAVHHNHCCSSRHEHGCSKQHASSCRHQCSSCRTDTGCLSPRSSHSVDIAGHSVQGVTVAEESDVFDLSPSETTEASELSPQNETSTPPVLDEYCDPVDLKKQMLAADAAADELGACVAGNSTDDDYSVPYEVKKIMHESKLRERYARTGPDGLPLKITDFDEPHEWLAMLSSDHLTFRNSTQNSRTPLMTPKKQLRRQTPMTSIEDNSKKHYSSAEISVSKDEQNNEQLVDDDGDDDDEDDVVEIITEQQREPVMSSVFRVDNCLNDTSYNNNSNSIAQVSVTCYNANSLTELSPGIDCTSLAGMSFSFSLELESANGAECFLTAVNGPEVTAVHRQQPSSVTASGRSHRHDGHLSSHQSATDVDACSSEAGHLQHARNCINPDVALEQQSWYHGSLGRLEAEEVLRQQPEGSFLVRKSQSNKQDYSLSLKSASGFLHIKIVCHDGSYILGQFSQPFDSVSRMVEFFSQCKLPIRGNEDICLLYPVPHS